MSHQRGSSVVRLCRWRLTAAVRSALFAALVPVGCASKSAGAASERSSRAAGSRWLSRPGQAPDPCVRSLAVTAVTATGAVRPATWPHSAAASKFDCFYVYPTTSLANTENTGLALTKLETGVAIEQAAPFSQFCDVWAPLYRSQTFSSVKKGLAGDEAVMRSTFTVAYDSVLAAWRSFLAHSGAKPIVLVGDSQGSAVLIYLISAQLDHEPSVLRRLIVVILLGGDLQVPSGKTVGATFTKVPLCTATTETRCAIAFSSYPSQPPTDSVFGRPGQGVSLQSGQTTKAGEQVACVNPATLTRRTGNLDPYVLTPTQIGLKEHVPTPWVVPVRPGVIVGRLRHRQLPGLVERDVTAGHPVEQRAGLVVLVRDEAVHRHRAVHDHLAHGLSPLLGKCP